MLIAAELMIITGNTYRANYINENQNFEQKIPNCFFPVTHSVELMIGRLESQLKSKLLTLTGQRNQLTQETETLDVILADVELQLRTSR